MEGRYNGKNFSVTAIRVYSWPKNTIDLIYFLSKLWPNHVSLSFRSYAARPSLV